MAGQNARSEEARESQRFAMQRAERRRVWLTVLLPFLIVLAIAVVIIGTVLSLRSPVQVSVLSDSMLTVLVLCPLVICMFPLVLLSLISVSLFNRLHPRSRSPLRRLEAWTALMEQNIDDWLGNVDERVVNWAVRFAPVRQILTTFDPPTVESSDEEIE